MDNELQELLYVTFGMRSIVAAQFPGSCTCLIMNVTQTRNIASASLDDVLTGKQIKLFSTGTQREVGRFSVALGSHNLHTKQYRRPQQ